MHSNMITYLSTSVTESFAGIFSKEEDVCIPVLLGSYPWKRYIGTRYQLRGETAFALRADIATDVIWVKIRI